MTRKVEAITSISIGLLSNLISPYSKRGVTISTNYNTVNLLRTIEDLLGIDHLNQSDAKAAPMSDVFMRDPDFTPYPAMIREVCALLPLILILFLHAKTPARKSLRSRLSYTTRLGGPRSSRASIFTMPIASTPRVSTVSCGRESWAMRLIPRCAASSTWVRIGRSCWRSGKQHIRTAR